MQPEVAARLRGIERSFGAVTALAGADLELRAGEVHGVLGANGAGKTTLLSVLGGVLEPDAGTIEIHGTEVTLGSPRDAWRHGVALVHQHFTLVPALTVLENLALGRRVGAARSLDLATVRREADALSERTGLAVPLDAPVERLGVGDRQRTEILKALLREPRVLVLDEPTAVLAPQEIDGLCRLLESLAADGRAIALVAHKLDEVLAVADRVTVLRDGRTVMTASVDSTDARQLVRAMIGSARGSTTEPELVPGPLPRRRAPLSRTLPVIARLEGVGVRDARDRLVLDDVWLVVGRGEIVGIAGVEGNGQHELALLLAGRGGAVEGRVSLPASIGFVPQDRSSEGLIAGFDLTENLALALHRDTRFRWGPCLRWSALERESEALRIRYDVAAPGPRTRAGALSGGNQQRIVVGRELSVGADLVIAENPTRGLDISASAFVRAEICRLTERPAEGPGVVLVSTDLDEVLALADRVFVMSRGRLIPIDDVERTPEGVGSVMLAGARG